MKQNIAVLTASGCAALALMMTGCATQSDYVDATDTQIAVKNKDSMSSSDWLIISAQAGQDMLSSPQFAEYLQAYTMDAEEAIQAAKDKGEKMSARESLNAKKPLLMLSAITNNTGEHIDTKLMTERLRTALFNSGKVRFTTYAAGAGQTIDAASAQGRELKHDSNVKKSTLLKKGQVRAYDLSLGGSIIKQKAESGRDREISYTFNLTLTDSVTGEGVWTYNKEIKRQHKQGGLGW